MHFIYFLPYQQNYTYVKIVFSLNIQKHSSQLHNCFNDGNLNPVSIIQVTCHNFQSFSFSVFELGNDGETTSYYWTVILSATTKPWISSPNNKSFQFSKDKTNWCLIQHCIPKIVIFYGTLIFGWKPDLKLNSDWSILRWGDPVWREGEKMPCTNLLLISIGNKKCE